MPIGSRRIILGDDLGAERYINASARFDFADVPFLSKYGIKPFVFGEYIFYPPSTFEGSLSEQIRKFSRGGLGFGLSIPLPIGDNLSIQIYHNALLFNPLNKGDIARTGLINLDFGFF